MNCHTKRAYTYTNYKLLAIAIITSKTKKINLIFFPSIYPPAPPIPPMPTTQTSPSPATWCCPTTTSALPIHHLHPSPGWSSSTTQARSRRSSSRCRRGGASRQAGRRFGQASPARRQMPPSRKMHNEKCRRLTLTKPRRKTSASSGNFIP